MNLRYLISKLIKKIHIPAIINSTIDKTSRICSDSHVVNAIMGRYSYIGNSCTIVNTQIGNFCSIADNCIIGGASHPIEWVSTSPVFHEGKNIMEKNFSEHSYNVSSKTIIENDVWIGNNCLIKSGVKIENGAVIGMGSVLTKNVGPYEIWAGNPAKCIRKRFTNQIAEELLKSAWWEYDDEILAKHASSFNEVETYLSLKSKDK